MWNRRWSPELAAGSTADDPRDRSPIHDDNLVACIFSMHPKNGTRFHILKPHATFNFRLHKLAIHFVAEVFVGPE
jgi:hypothetical protein